MDGPVTFGYKAAPAEVMSAPECMLKRVNELTEVRNGIPSLDRVGGLIGQERLQEISPDGWIGVQERGPCGVDHINRVGELRRNPLAALKEQK